MTIERLKDGELGKTGYMCAKSPKYIGHKSGKFKSELTELGIEAEIEKEKGGIK